MQISYNIISDYLNKNGVTTRALGNEERRYSDVRMYFPECKFDKSILYFCTAENIPAQWMNAGLGFIVPECSIDGESISESSILICDCEEKQLFELVQECFYTYEQWHLKLCNCVMKNGTLDELLYICNPIINNPMMIDDVSFRTLAFSIEYEANRFQDSEWAYIVTKGYHSPEYVETLVKSEIFTNTIVAAGAPFKHKFDFLAHPSIYCYIRNEEKIVAFLTVVELSTPFTKGSIETVEMLAEILMMMFGSEQNYLLSRKSFDDGIIRDMLHGVRNEREICTIALAEAGLQNSEKYFIAKLTSLHTHTGNYHMMMRTMDMLQGMLKKCKLILDDNSIYVIVNENQSKLSRTDILGISEEYIRYNQFLIGFSLSFYDLYEMGVYAKQAGKAIEFGFMTDKARHVFYYEETMQYDLLHSYGEVHDLAALSHPAVAVLADVDAQKGTELLTTLRLLLNNQCDSIKTANELFLHKNSMYYRIKQITTLTNISLQEESEREHLKLTFKIRDLLEHRESLK